MNIFLSIIWRLVVISFALLVAILAAGFLIGFGLSSGLLSEFIGHDPGTFLEDPDVEFAILTIASFGIGLVASFQLAGVAMVPVFLAILIAEMARWTGMITHLIMGGVCGMVILLNALPADTSPQEGTIIVTLAASFIASFFYWLIAGRGSGNWQKHLKQDLTSFGKEDADSEG